MTRNDAVQFFKIYGLEFLYLKRHGCVETLLEGYEALDTSDNTSYKDASFTVYLFTL